MSNCINLYAIQTALPLSERPSLNYWDDRYGTDLPRSAPEAALSVAHTNPTNPTTLFDQLQPFSTTNYHTIHRKFSSVPGL
jgi:hypothetical protein